MNETPRESNHNHDDAPRSDQACPNYSFYRDAPEAKGRVAWLSCTLSYLRGLDVRTLALVLTLVGLAAIGIALASPLREVTASGAFGACAVALILAVVGSVVVLMERVEQRAKTSEEHTDDPPHT